MSYLATKASLSWRSSGLPLLGQRLVEDGGGNPPIGGKPFTVTGVGPQVWQGHVHVLFSFVGAKTGNALLTVDSRSGGAAYDFSLSPAHIRQDGTPVF